MLTGRAQCIERERGREKREEGGWERGREKGGGGAARGVSGRERGNGVEEN